MTLNSIAERSIAQTLEAIDNRIVTQPCNEIALHPLASGNGNGQYPPLLISAAPGEFPNDRRQAKRAKQTRAFFLIRSSKEATR